MASKKSWSRGFWHTNENGKKVRTKTPVFDDPRKTQQWVEKGSGFYNTRGKWVSTGKPPTPKEIQKAVKASVDLANKKITNFKKAGLDDFSAELKKHSVFLDKQGFFQKDLSGKSFEEIAAMLQQVADFNENAEPLEDLEEARDFYDQFLEDEESLDEEAREEHIKELRKLVDTAAQEIYDLTRDSDFLDHLYNVLDNDVDRMDYIKQFAGNWFDLTESPAFGKWASYDYSDFEDLRK